MQFCYSNDMRILVISDTHGCVERAFAAHSQCEPIDAIIHLGDGSDDADLLRDVLQIPVINVAGNCDVTTTAPRERIWECAGHCLLLTHGDRYQVKAGLAKLRQRAVEVDADVVMFGHTHVALYEEISGFTLLNPGNMARYGQYTSYAVVEISTESLSVQHFSLI